VWSEARNGGIQRGTQHHLRIVEVPGSVEFGSRNGEKRTGFDDADVGALIQQGHGRPEMIRAVDHNDLARTTGANRLQDTIG